MTHPIKLHTHHAPKPKVRRMTEAEIKSLLVKAREEIDNGEIRLASRLVEEVIEAIRP